MIVVNVTFLDVQILAHFAFISLDESLQIQSNSASSSKVTDKAEEQRNRGTEQNSNQQVELKKGLPSYTWLKK